MKKSIVPPTMNADQQHAVDLVLQGHSILLTGNAGTGKTHVTRNIIDQLRLKGKSVIVCSSTGIACSQLHQQGAQTVHRTFGLKDGRFSLEQLTYLFSGDASDKYYQDRAAKICGANTLVIDEISMISEKILHQVEHVCRIVRDQDLCMGGLQCIFVGDYLQLPPVPSKLLQDPGHHSFRHPLFSTMVSHIVKLLLVVRQDEPLLIQAINELSYGTPTPTTIAFLKSLEGRINVPAKDKRVLFSMNDYARLYNREEVMQLNGREYIYKSDDEGSSEHLRKMQVEGVRVHNEG